MLETAGCARMGASVDVSGERTEGGADGAGKLALALASGEGALCGLRSVDRFLLAPCARHAHDDVRTHA